MPAGDSNIKPHFQMLTPRHKFRNNWLSRWLYT